jgi:malto-oligosyltrehalose trehalohydrolase
MPVTPVRFGYALPFGAEVQDGGVRFRLWAPSKAAAGVVVDGTECALRATGDGWFEGLVDGARAGSRYVFSFRDSDLRVPDPASRFQPEGVHAPSMVVDPRRYAWQTPEWRGRPKHELVFYELHVGTFTAEGTYAAAMRRLDDLVTLGITALELMPLAQPAGTRNWGYDGVFAFAPQYAYGMPDDLKAFIDAAHARGLCVFLDVVYNHFGPEGNYLHAYAEAFFTPRHKTPWGAAINVDDRGGAAVRDFFVHNARFWLDEYRFDGLRLDAVHEIHDDSPRPYLQELSQRVRAGIEPGRAAQLVLENDANDPALLSWYDAQWNDDVHHALHVLLTGERDAYYRDFAAEPGRLLARALAEGFAYQGEPSRHRRGAPRGAPSAGLPATSFVNFLQNHDQVGNRAFGERVASLAPDDAVRAASTVVMLAPALPLLFMGEEWSATTPFLFFSDFGAELGTAVTEGRRREFAAWPAFSDPDVRARIPDPQDPATMRASTLDWDEREIPRLASMLAFHRELLRARAEHIVPHLAGGAHGDGFTMLAETAFSVRWRFGDGTGLGLVANLGEADVAATYRVEGRRIFAHGEVAPELACGLLRRWSAAWFLAS